MVEIIKIIKRHQYIFTARAVTLQGIPAAKLDYICALLEVVPRAPTKIRRSDFHEASLNGYDVSIIIQIHP